MTTSIPSVGSYYDEAIDWLAARRSRVSKTVVEDASTAVFHNLPYEHELGLIQACASWQKEKFQAGYGAIAWPVENGGAGLTQRHESAFLLAEKQFAVPHDHELRRITTNLVAPTVRDLGSSELHGYIVQFLSCDLLVCQLFSEPGAGSDLAGLSTRASQSSTGWTISGSKVWVSGAQFADFGLLLARTGTMESAHAGITAFLLPMSAPGLEIRPIQQMTGGSSFNEVFMTDVELSDDFRLGEVGAGWSVARTMLSYERNQSGSKAGVGGSWEQLLEFATSSRELSDTERDAMAHVYSAELVRGLIRRRADIARSRGEQPGAEGSLGKLLWANSLTMIGDAAAMVAGPALIASDENSGAFGWSEHVLGALGFHIAGGTDEIQRNIIAERLLGLPREPKFT